MLFSCGAESSPLGASARRTGGPRRGPTRVGLFDLSHLGKVDVEGPEVLGGLQALLTNDLARIAVGRAQYNLLLHGDGGAAEDLIAYRLDGERWFIVPNAANTATACDAMASVGLAPRPLEDWCFLGVQGPSSSGRGARPTDAIASHAVAVLAALGTMNQRSPSSR
ncbi:MAG: hypothetical protein ACKOI0_02775 [Actinomycetota bacterium]